MGLFIMSLLVLEFLVTILTPVITSNVMQWLNPSRHGTVCPQISYSLEVSVPKYWISPTDIKDVSPTDISGGGGGGC